MQADELKKIIEAGIPSAQVTVQGDGDHFEATIVSPDFEGRNKVQQHQMVYEALKGRMGNELHALALQTSAPTNG